AYFVTICTLNRQEILAEICRGGALLLPIGEICKTQIDEIQKKYNVIIDKYVIMPNHIHLIICINLSENYKPVNTTINKII
ncbi:MAG: transposase, partial [Oscillospiraceae bacterium]